MEKSLTEHFLCSVSIRALAASRRLNVARNADPSIKRIYLVIARNAYERLRFQGRNRDKKQLTLKTP